MQNAETGSRETMATEPQKPKEHPSTYFVQDRSNEEELARLRVQD